ncbi:MAG: GNAT family N-acetyltransferase [Candidatus Eisenbacteria bacterium]
MTLRDLDRSEIELVWTIDRAETIEGIYRHEGGRLELKPERFDVTGWPPGDDEVYTPEFEACFDRGGAFRGVFDGDKLVGVVIMDSRFIGRNGDQLQMKFLHVDRARRGTGLGRRLFEEGVEIARSQGARRVYVSATPSEHTIGFYTHLGCAVTDDVDRELFELEPEDIHLEYVIPE